MAPATPVGPVKIDPTKTRMVQELKHNSPLIGCRIDPSGRFVFCGAEDNALVRWELAGGIYGVAVGGLFAGESMFHAVTDASKVALVALVERLRTRGYVLFDVQMTTDHTSRMGAVEVPRAEYLRRLREAVRLTEVTFA